VPGTVAAAMNDECVVGVAPDVRLHAPRVLAPLPGNKCSGPVQRHHRRRHWAAQNGIQVTNNSYGSTSPSATARPGVCSMPVSIDSSHYAASGGGKGKTKDLTVTIGTVYGPAAAVSATAGVEVYCNGAFVTHSTVTTDQNGLRSPLLATPGWATHQTIVIWATSPSLDWDVRTPAE
jgi:hypothetical protein